MNALWIKKKLAVYQKIYGCLIEIVKTVLDSVWELLLQRYHEDNTLGDTAS